MSKKKTFVTLEQLKEIDKTYPTPYHLYDEKGIRENAKRLKEAFSWNKGYREYFAVKATPNPYILKILKDYGCGVDCASMAELMMGYALDYKPEEIMFSSNDTPAEEYAYANEIGATINLDDITHKILDGKFPETMSCRYNPGGYFQLGTSIMDNPGDAKYGMTHDQIIEAFKILKSKGVKHFGIHSFLASNTVSNEYYPTLAQILFELAVELRDKTGADIKFVNLSGGVGVAYKPDQEPNDIAVIGEGVHKVYDEVLGAAGMGDIGRHFPDTAVEFKGADSFVLLQEAARRVREKGWEFGNIDSTVIAQKPKLAPHIPTMQQRIADALGISVEQVNVKAKTAEKMGPVGELQAMEANAVALIYKP